MARVIVADDCSGEEHLAALRAHRGDRRAGRLRSQQRASPRTSTAACAASDGERDVVVLNSDIEALAELAGVPAVRRLRHEDGAGIVGAQLQYPDGRIQFGGTVRNRDAPEWFDHRYRFKPHGWGPAEAPSPALAVTGACMYVRREVIERIGACSTSATRWPTRTSTGACAPGRRAFACCTSRAPSSCTTSRSRAAPSVGERERASQRLFWERWSEFFDARR